jgi:hypothetical protein
VSAPRYEHRLNGARFSGVDPHLALAGAVIVMSLADARDFDYPARQADAVEWLSEGGIGRQWCEMLGGAEVLADALAEMD